VSLLRVWLLPAKYTPTASFPLPNVAPTVILEPEEIFTFPSFEYTAIPASPAVVSEFPVKFTFPA